MKPRALLIMAIACAVPAWVWAQVAPGAGEPPLDLAAALPLLAAALVPFVSYLAKQFVEKLVPDALITALRDEWLPFLVPWVGLFTEALTKGQLDFSLQTTATGLVVGLAGIGVHQVLKYSGLLVKRS